MYITQALQPPVIVNVGNNTVSFPKITLDDWMVISQMHDLNRDNSRTAGLTQSQKFHFISTYPLAPLSLLELRKLAGSPAGIPLVIRQSMRKAKIIAKKEGDSWKILDVPIDAMPVDAKGTADTTVLNIVLSSHSEDQEVLAMAIADLIDLKSASEPATEDESSQDDQDPLASANQTKMPE